MGKKAIILILFYLPLTVLSQHTFSIVAVDSLTGEIGSAGATCGDSIIWPNSPGAKIISDVIPGIGAIHTQAYYIVTNQTNAHNRMVSGYSPQQIINWLISNDATNNASIRQYGIVDYNGGQPRSAGFTGPSCNNYKNHITGPNYAIQGNILLGQQILDSMESGFLNTVSMLSDRLMAALQGANVIGADTRCTSEGTSSLSAFIRIAKPNDHADTLHLDINIAGTPPGVEPIDELQKAYDLWKMTSGISKEYQADATRADIYPNPTNGLITVKFQNIIPDEIKINNFLGEEILTTKTYNKRIVKIDLSKYYNGLYLLNYKADNNLVVRKISLRK